MSTITGAPVMVSDLLGRIGEVLEGLIKASEHQGKLSEKLEDALTATKIALKSTLRLNDCTRFFLGLQVVMLVVSALVSWRMVKVTKRRQDVNQVWVLDRSRRDLVGSRYREEKADISQKRS